jgi:hypothetical protein
MQHTHKQERRSGSERRTKTVSMDFPFVDTHGHLVTAERRKNDRRTENITSGTLGQSKNKSNKEKNYA